MPNTKSAKKRHKQSLVRRASNRSAKSELRTVTRKIREALAVGKVEDATKNFSVVVKKLDKAAAHGVIHSNAAARVKSRLSGAIKAIKTKTAAK
jgi:small subunit ribosomal protein S20